MKKSVRIAVIVATAVIVLSLFVFSKSSSQEFLTGIIKSIRNATTNAEIGTEILAKSISGSGFSNIHDIKPTYDNGYILVGSFAGEADLNGDGVVEVTSKGDFDALVAKYDKNGEFQWYQSYGNSGEDQFYSVSETSKGEYIVVGFETTEKHKDGIIIKYDRFGREILWKKTIVGDLDDELKNVLVLSTGDIVISCKFNSPSVILDTGITVSSSGTYDGFIICYDGEKGTYKWSQLIDGSNNVDITGITETDKGIVISANYLQNIKVNNTTITTKGGQDAILIAYDLEGKYQWHQVIGGTGSEAIDAIATDKENNVVAVGSYGSNFKLGNDSLSVIVESSVSALEVKYSSDGNYLSNYNFGKNVRADDKLTSVVATKDGGVLIAGWFFNVADINGDNIVDYTSDGENYGDGIIIKLNKDQQIEWSRNVTGTSFDEGYGVSQLRDGRYFVVGNFDSDTVSSKNNMNILSKDGYNDSFMMRIVSDGQKKDIICGVEYYQEDVIPEIGRVTTVAEESNIETIADEADIEGIAEESSAETTEEEKTFTKVEEDTKEFKNEIPVLDEGTVELTDKDTLNPNDKYVGYKLGKMFQANNAYLPHEEEIEITEIPEEANNDTAIKIQYIVDEEQRKNVSYTVEYYKDGELQAEDTNVVEKDVQVLQPDALEVEETSINKTDKYVGYKFDKVVKEEPQNNSEIIDAALEDEASVEEKVVNANLDNESIVNENLVASGENTNTVTNITVQENNETIELEDNEEESIKEEAKVLNNQESSEIVKSGTVLKVYYVLDEEQKKDAEYTVEYYKGEEKAEEQKYKENVHILQETLPVTEEFVQMNGRYEGYKVNDIIIVETNVKTNNEETKDELIEGNEVASEITEEENSKTYHVDELPSEVKDGAVIKIYYVIDEEQTKDVTYTIEYYKAGEKTDDSGLVTTQVQVLSPAVAKINKTEIESKYTGFVIDSIEQNGRIIDELPTEVAEGTVIKVYYIRQTFTYKVEWYDAEEDKLIKTEDRQAMYEDTVNVKEEDKSVEGYVYDENNENNLITVEVVDNTAVLKLYFTKERFTYTLTYDANGGENAPVAQTETSTDKQIEFTISSEKPSRRGYKFLGWADEKSAAVAHNTGDKITLEQNITLYAVWERDEEQRNDLSYTVEYYKDGTKDSEQTITESVQVLDTAIIVDQTKINTTNKYEGYDLEKIQKGDEVIAALPATVEEGTIIKIYYVKNSETKKDISYKVEYYKNGTKAEEETITERVHVSETVAPVDANKINISNKYVGYKFEKLQKDDELIASLPTTVEDGTIIKVYYVLNTADTKEMTYTVKYYKDGTEVESIPVTKEVHVLENTLPVDTAEINTIDKYTGYKLEKIQKGNEIVSEIPAQVENGTVISVYYVLNAADTKELSYKVQYYKDGIKTDEETVTEEVQVLENTIPVKAEKINTTNKYVGYKLEKIQKGDEEIATLPATVEKDTVIKVYYVKDETQTKTLSYKVEYYKGEAKIEEETITESVHVSETVVPVVSNKINMTDKYAGYKFEKLQKDSEDIENLPSNVEEGTIIKIYYVINTADTKEMTYTVKYYKDGVEAESIPVTKEVQVLENTVSVNVADINTINKYEGYRLEKIQKGNEVVSEIPAQVEDGTVISVYYVINTATTKEMTYTVKYYKDGVEAESIPVTKEVQVLENTVSVNVADINTINKYEGYRLEKIQKGNEVVSEIPAQVEDGTVIGIYYVKDSEAKKELSYRVEYYKDGEKQVNDSATVTQRVHITAEDKLDVKPATINTTDRYVGYKFERTDPEVIPEKVNNGTIISVYYVKDETQTKEINYTIEYYKDGLKQIKDTQKPSKTVHVLEEDTLAVDKNINANNKYLGYKLEKTEIDATIITDLPDEVQNGTVISVYYVKDETQLKDLSYTIVYTKDGEKADEKTVEQKVHVLEPDTIKLDKSLIKLQDQYYGYILNSIKISTKPEMEKANITAEELLATLPDEVQNGTIIEADYIVDETQTKDVTYRVEYYKDNVKQENDTENITDKVQVLKPSKTTVDISKINKENKYEDYAFARSVPEVIPTEINDGEVIRIYYEKKDKKVVIEFIDQATGKPILDSVDVSGCLGEEYDITSQEKEIPGYVLVEKPSSTGIFTEQEQRKVYYYAKATTVTVKYLEKNTNKELLTTETINGYQGKEYNLIRQDIPGYVLVERPSNAEGTMTETPITVIFYYAQVSNGVIEKHIDINSNYVLHSETHKGNAGDAYSISSKTFEGYDLVESKLPDNNKGTMTTNVIEVKYYYVRKSKIIVEFIDRETNEKIAEDVIIDGHEGDSYKAEQKDVTGYKVAEVAKNESGTFGKDEIKVTYYYKKIPAEVIEKHIDINTDKVLSEEIHKGKEGDPYKIEPKAIEGYDLVDTKLPDNAEGTMTEIVKEVKFYYIRKTKVIVEYINKTTNEKIIQDLVIDGHEGDTYKIEEKAIEGFKLVEKPENLEGTMQLVEKEDGTIETTLTLRLYYEKDTGNAGSDKPGTSDKPNNTNTDKNNNGNNNSNQGNSAVNSQVTTGNGDVPNNNTVSRVSIVPGTGDIVPMSAVSIIIFVIMINGIQYASTVKVSKISKNDKHSEK